MGAGSRWASWGPVPSCAEEDGSAVGGSEVAAGGVETGGWGGAEVTGGAGGALVGAGSPGATVFPGLAGLPDGAVVADASSAPGDGATEALGDSPGFGLPPLPCLPSAERAAVPLAADAVHRTAVGRLTGVLPGRVRGPGPARVVTHAHTVRPRPR
ncbi:hypothetical protein ACQ4WX_24185 [Streptomyces lasalocidi]